MRTFSHLHFEEASRRRAGSRSCWRPADPEDDLVAVLVDQRALLGDERRRDDRRTRVFMRATLPLQCVDRGARQHQVLVAQEVVDVEPLGAQHLDPRQVARGALDACRRPPSITISALSSMPSAASSSTKSLVFGAGELDAIDDQRAAPRGSFGASAERSAACGARCRHAIRVVARLRAEDRRAARPRAASGCCRRARVRCPSASTASCRRRGRRRASWSTRVPARRFAGCMLHDLVEQVRAAAVREDRRAAESISPTWLLASARRRSPGARPQPSASARLHRRAASEHHARRARPAPRRARSSRCSSGGPRRPRCSAS